MIKFKEDNLKFKNILQILIYLHNHSNSSLSHSQQPTYYLNGVLQCAGKRLRSLEDLAKLCSYYLNKDVTPDKIVKTVLKYRFNSSDGYKYIAWFADCPDIKKVTFQFVFEGEKGSHIRFYSGSIFHKINDPESSRDMLKRVFRRKKLETVLAYLDRKAIDVDLKKLIKETNEDIFKKPT
jgi:hypothetical protein